MQLEAGYAHAKKKGAKHYYDDAFRCDPERGLFIIADGVGGLKKPADASDIAAGNIYRDLVPRVDIWSKRGGVGQDEIKKSLSVVALDAHRTLRNLSEHDPRYHPATGTTIDVCLAAPTDFSGVHLGDSYVFVGTDSFFMTPDKLYKLSGGKIVQEVVGGRVIPHDRKSELVRILQSINGEITLEDYLGREGAKPRFFSRSGLNNGYWFVMMTDGVRNAVYAQEIYNVVTRLPPREAALKLMSMTETENGGWRREMIEKAETGNEREMLLRLFMEPSTFFIDAAKYQGISVEKAIANFEGRDSRTIIVGRVR